MPIAYDILPDLNLIVMAGWDRCAGEDYVVANRAAARDPRRQPGQDALLDLRCISALSVVPAELQAIVTMDRDLAAAGVYGTYRTVLVVGNDTHEMLVTLYNALVQKEGMGVEICRTFDDAVTWLGLDAARDRLAAVCRRLTGRDPDAA